MKIDLLFRKNNKKNQPIGFVSVLGHGVYLRALFIYGLLMMILCITYTILVLKLIFYY